MSAVADSLAAHELRAADRQRAHGLLGGHARAAAAGCPLIQIREKDLSPEELRRFAAEAIRVARPHGARILINDDIEAARAVGADGVHLRSRSLSAAASLARDGDLLIGASTHSLDEVRAAAGADFLVCGPVYDTPSKRAYGPPLGLERFAALCRAAAIPVLALGGITLENHAEALECGGAGIAGIGLFSHPETIEAPLRALLSPAAGQPGD